MPTLLDHLPAYGFVDGEGVLWRLGEAWEANELLSRHHYLGPMKSGGRLVVIGAAGVGREPVAAMVWRYPTSRNLPAFGSWLELSRWCLTPDAGDNAGSRMHRWSVRLIREHLPAVTTLVSYSDPAHGHNGALYRACNWQWAPTWHRLRTPPSGNGDWGTGPQAVKDRWVFCVKDDETRAEVLHIDDAAAVRYWQKNATEVERRWAKRSLNLASVDVQVADRIPADEAPVLDAQATTGDALDHDVLAVQADDPSGLQVEQERRIGLAPVKSHEGHATRPALRASP